MFSFLKFWRKKTTPVSPWQQSLTGKPVKYRVSYTMGGHAVLFPLKSDVNEADPMGKDLTDAIWRNKPKPEPVSPVADFEDYEEPLTDTKVDYLKKELIAVKEAHKQLLTQSEERDLFNKSRLLEMNTAIQNLLERVELLEPIKLDLVQYTDFMTLSDKVVKEQREQNNLVNARLDMERPVCKKKTTRRKK